MSERIGIDAVEVVTSLDTSRCSVGCRACAEFDLAALFASGGIEGDGDLVLRRVGDDVRVVGRAVRMPDPHCEDCDGEGWVEVTAEGGSLDCACFSSSDIHRIVEAPDAG